MRWRQRGGNLGSCQTTVRPGQVGAVRCGSSCCRGRWAKPHDHDQAVPAHATLESHSSPHRRADSSGSGRPPLSRAERGALQIVAVALVGFCIYGFAAGSPRTVGYLFSGLVIGAAIVWLPRGALSDLLPVALSIAALVGLFGGRFNVSHGVAYTPTTDPDV